MYRFDPDLAPVISLLPEVDLSDVDAARRALETLAAGFPPVDRSGVEVTDRLVPGPADHRQLAVRVYRPVSAERPAPAVVYLHGGGFVLGSVALEDGAGVGLCRELKAVVVSVEYRLAPEHPYPAGLEDAYAALVWLHEAAAELGVDPDRVAVAGQSAGGGLAAAVALLVRDRGGPPLCFQLLGIPELDDRLETPSMQMFTDTPLWNRPAAERSWALYLGSDPGADDVPVYAAPARATDLGGLPPAYVSVMEFDPLRDEGLAYANALLQAGVGVELHLFPGAFHGAAAVTGSAVARRQQADIVEALRRGLRPAG